MRVDVPIYGLSGGAFASSGGGKVTPGPMFWRQQRVGYTESLKLVDGGGLALTQLTKGPGIRASPGHAATYMKVGGSHGAGTGGTIASDASSPVKAHGVRLRYACSQSEQAQILKRGNGGSRKGGKRKGAERSHVQGETGAASSSVNKRARGLVPSHDCGARFTASLRNSKSRTEKCSLCKAPVTYSHEAAPDPVPFPTALVHGVCPWGH